MHKQSQRGAIQYIILLILIAGLVAGVYLVQKTQIFKPKASGIVRITPTTSFTLFSDKQRLKVGEDTKVQIMVHADIAAANLFAAKMNYDPQILHLKEIEITPSFITNWTEQYFDNSTGAISVVGGVPNPGFQTQVRDTSVMATIQFTALKAGTTTISFADTSAIYSNADNTNILVGKNPITLTLSSGVTPTATPTSTPVATPTPSPTPVGVVIKGAVAIDGTDAAGANRFTAATCPGQPFQQVPGMKVTNSTLGDASWDCGPEFYFGTNNQTTVNLTGVQTFTITPPPGYRCVGYSVYGDRSSASFNGCSVTAEWSANAKEIFIWFNTGSNSHTFT